MKAVAEERGIAVKDLHLAGMSSYEKMGMEM